MKQRFLGQITDELKSICEAVESFHSDMKGTLHVTRIKQIAGIASRIKRLITIISDVADSIESYCNEHFSGMTKE